MKSEKAKQYLLKVVTPIAMNAPLLNREAEFACMSYRERLALKHSDPDTYRRLREK